MKTEKDICGYASFGGCSPGITHVIKGYFRDRRSLWFCEKHAEEWNHLHPFGPIAKRDAEGGHT